jgi:hypothetical protein
MAYGKRWGIETCAMPVAASLAGTTSGKGRQPYAEFSKLEVFVWNLPILSMLNA